MTTLTRTIHTPRNYNLYPRDTLDLDPAEFLKRRETESLRVVKVIPPVPGQRGWGKIRVKLNYTVYEPRHV
ncbi:MAG: hypothetical protein JJU29_13165 [Verrucomicrobia bacterium]|nr:hypothetical protein [Verrucomicrobiota bacterium]